MNVTTLPADRPRRTAAARIAVGGPDHGAPG